MPIGDQEQFGRDHCIGDGIAARYTGEHLRAHERYEHRIAFDRVHASAAERSGVLDARDDARRA